MTCWLCAGNRICAWGIAGVGTGVVNGVGVTRLQAASQPMPSIKRRPVNERFAASLMCGSIRWIEFGIATGRCAVPVFERAEFPHAVVPSLESHSHYAASAASGQLRCARPASLRGRLRTATKYLNGTQFQYSLHFDLCAFENGVTIHTLDYIRKGVEVPESRWVC